MNDHGVRFDLSFCRAALIVADEARDLLDREMADVTARAVPAATNIGALKRWLMDQGIDLTPPPDPFADDDDDDDDDDDTKVPELRRKDVERLLLDEAIRGRPRRALEIRLEAAKTSVKKLDAVLKRADAQGYVRGLISYHGTNTGRDSAAGGGVQIQNFPRDTIEDWDTARRMLALPDAAQVISALHGPPLETLSKMLRGAIIPDDGCDLISIDYAAVELRGVAWLAGQQDLVEGLRKDAKIYEGMASRVFGVPVEVIGKDSRERWLGKQIILGSGYQMGYQKFWRMCAGLGQQVEVDLAQRAIETYRSLYPLIPALWYEMNDAMIAAIRAPGSIVTAAGGRIRFSYKGMWLCMALPSGRLLRYAKPTIEVDERFNREGVVYWGVNPKTKQWSRQRTFGGRIVENAVQGLCRDLLMEGAARLKATGRYRLFTRVHDESVMNVKRGQGSVQEARDLMCVVPDWAKGFPLGSSGWIGGRYG
jgi:DNA polymerase